jgi:hypothetical protein
MGFDVVGRLELGQRVGQGGTLDDLRFLHRHRAPNAADPASVTRSTTCAGGIDGARGGCGWSTGETAGGTHTVGRTYLLAGIDFRLAGSP